MEEIFKSMFILDSTFSIWKILLRIVIAILAGFILGLENKSRSKDAGLKTHTILCLTACLLMIISKYGFYELSKFEGIQYDASRVASTIISGLCFMGAGVVFNRKETVVGLTTAISMCLTITIGMCIGSGLLITGVIVTFIVILLQKILHLNIGILKSPKSINVKAKFILEDNYIDYFKQLFDVKHFNKFKIYRENDIEMVEVEFNYKFKVTSEEIFDKVKNEKRIIAIEKTENR